MRITHFELLQPVCPVCQLAGRTPSRLAIGIVAAQQGDDVVEGILRCASADCRHEFPILDGIPLIVPQLREYVRGWIERIRGRQPFTEPVESLLGDCCGVGTSFEDERQRLSSYVWDHWGDCDPHEQPTDRSSQRPQPGDVSPGSVVQLLEAGLAMFGSQHRLPTGPVLDLGCSVGRTTCELALRLGRPVLGVDLDLSMLRLARQVRETATVTYPRRRVGLAYDRRCFTIPEQLREEAMPHIDYWCCDATVLPFASGSCAAASSLNLLDCVASPLTHLQEIGRVLQPNGLGVVASPYDWSTAATPVEAWVGGHSQRGEGQGSSDRLLRQLMGAGHHPAAIADLAIVGESPSVPWYVRLHERSVMHYASDLLVVKKTSHAAAGTG
jgi:SAM-dependent methyltransferase/uncharacterized protein YbaR (Trm112 family)